MTIRRATMNTARQSLIVGTPEWSAHHMNTLTARTRMMNARANGSLSALWLVIPTSGKTPVEWLRVSDEITGEAHGAYLTDADAQDAAHTLLLRAEAELYTRSARDPHTLTTERAPVALTLSPVTLDPYGRADRIYRHFVLSQHATQDGIYRPYIDRAGLSVSPLLNRALTQMSKNARGTSADPSYLIADRLSQFRNGAHYTELPETSGTIGAYSTLSGRRVRTFTRETFAGNHLDISDDGTMLSYMPANIMVQTASNAPGENYPASVYQHPKRVCGKPARILRTLSPLVLDGIPEYAVSGFTAECQNMLKPLDMNAFQLVSGQHILDSYLDDSMSDICEWSSCMTDADAQEYLTMYAENPAVCSLLVLTDDDGCTLGRALIWTLAVSTREAPGTPVRFMDRVYANTEHAGMFSTYAEAHGIYDCLPEGSYVQLSPDHTRFPSYPYMDTFYVLDTNGCRLYPDSSTLTRSGYHTLRSTEGGPNLFDREWSVTFTRTVSITISVMSPSRSKARAIAEDLIEDYEISDADCEGEWAYDYAEDTTR